jgi:hypothetical protein
VDISRDRRVAFARVATAAGELRARAWLDERGYVTAAGEPSGVASRRARERDLLAEFTPPEIVDTSAVLVEGEAAPGRGLSLLIRGVRAPLPRLEEIPNQAVALTAQGDWQVTVEPHPGAADLRDVRERTSYVARALEDDLAAFALVPEEALAVGRGDCTAHAIVLKGLLEQRGYQARLVTGFVLDDGALRRHRWVVVKVNRRWVPVDPMFDEAPASPAHLALAVHGSSPDELAFIDEIAFAGWEQAKAVAQTPKIP